MNLISSPSGCQCLLPSHACPPGFVPTASQNSRWFMMSPKSELSLTLPLRERTALLATQRCILLARVSRSRAESRQPENRPPGSARGEGSTASRIPDGLRLWPVPRSLDKAPTGSTDLPLRCSDANTPEVTQPPNLELPVRKMGIVILNCRCLLGRR